MRNRSGIVVQNWSNRPTTERLRVSLQVVALLHNNLNRVCASVIKQKNLKEWSPN